MTVFLKFQSREQFLESIAQLAPKASLTESGFFHGVLPQGVQSLLIVGYTTIGGKYELDPNDPSGTIMLEVEAPHVVPGFHVNMLGEVPAAWAGFQVYPDSPQCTF